MLRLSRRLKFSNPNLSLLWENSKPEVAKKLYGSAEIDVSIAGGKEQYTLTVPKSCTFKDLAMYIGYLPANNSCMALQKKYAVQVEEESEEGNGEKGNTEKKVEDICDSEIRTEVRSMHEAVTSDSQVEFLTANSKVRHLSDKTNFKNYMAQVNNSIYKTGQIILLKSLKRALPKETKVWGFRRPTYDFKEAPAFCYDVIIENGEFLKESFDDSRSQDANNSASSQMRQILKNERLQLLNVHAREILQEKIPAESLILDNLAVAGSRADVDDELRMFLGDRELVDETDRNKIDELVTNLQRKGKNSVKLVKFGDHIEAMKLNENTLPNTSFLKHFAITNMTLLGNINDSKSIYRIQGICSPELLDSEVFRILELNAQKFVKNDLLETVDMARHHIYNEYINIENQFKGDHLKSLQPNKSNSLWKVDFNPLYCSLETDLKYFNNKMQSSLLTWISPYENLVEKSIDKNHFDPNFQKFIFEKENLKNLKLKSEKSVAMKQAKHHKFGPMYETNDQHKHLLYQGDAVLHLGLNGEKYSAPDGEAERRWEEWNQALHFICMIGGPIIQDCRWYRRKYLNPRAMGRWDMTF